MFVLSNASIIHIVFWNEIYLPDQRFIGFLCKNNNIPYTKANFVTGRYSANLIPMTFIWTKVSVEVDTVIYPMSLPIILLSKISLGQIYSGRIVFQLGRHSFILRKTIAFKTSTSYKRPDVWYSNSAPILLVIRDQLHWSVSCNFAYIHVCSL